MFKIFAQKITIHSPQKYFKALISILTRKTIYTYLYGKMNKNQPLILFSVGGSRNTIVIVKVIIVYFILYAYIENFSQTKNSFSVFLKNNKIHTNEHLRIFSVLNIIIFYKNFKVFFKYFFLPKVSLMFLTVDC